MNNLEKLIEIHFEGQLKIGSSEKIERENYDVQYSKMIADWYWNYAFLKSPEVDLKALWKEIKSDMQKLERQPVLYLMSNRDNSKIEKQLGDCHLENLYTDCWMAIENLECFPAYESKLQVEISQVKEEEKAQFVQAVMEGFSSDDPEDPYGTLPEEYRKIYDLKFEDGEFHKLEYCAKYKEEMVGTANLWYKGECAIIYSVSTKKEFQKQGICKKMMSNIIKDLRKLGIDTVCVQTEKGFYTEKIYQNMGFEEVMLRRSVWREGKKLLTRRKNRSIL